MKTKVWKFGFTLTALIAAILLLVPLALNWFSRRMPDDGSLLTIKAGYSIYDVRFISNGELRTTGLHQKPVNTGRRYRLTYSIKRWNAQDGKDLGERIVSSENPTFSDDGRIFIDRIYNANAKTQSFAAVKSEDFSVISQWSKSRYDSITHWAMSNDGSRAAGVVLKDSTRNILKPQIKTLRIGGVQVWDTKTGKPLWFVEESRSDEWLNLDLTHTFLAFSPDGKLLAEANAKVISRDSWIATYKMQILLRDAETGRRVRLLKEREVEESGSMGLDGGWALVLFSPDSKLLLALSSKSYKLENRYPQEIQVWNIETGQMLWSVARDKFRPEAAAFSPDGSIIACGSNMIGRPDGFDGGELSLWDAKTGKLLRSMSGETRTDYVVYFLDSKVQSVRRAVTQIGSSNKSLGRSRLATDKSSPIRSLSFSPDGKRIATLHYNGNVKIWPVK